MTCRADVVAVVKSWEGAKQGSATQHKIIDIFNSKVGGMSYTAAWCAATASAAAIKAGAASYYPLSASCGAIINGARKMGIWVESDSFVPTIGDWVIYDWADGSNYANYDNREGHDHIGIVVAVGNGTFDVVEGNMGRPPRVGRRRMKVNGRYIRGFVHPRLSLTDVKPTPKPVVEQLVVDGIGGPKTVRRWQEQVGSAYLDGIISGQYKPNHKYFPAITSVTFEDTGESQLVKIVQHMCGIEVDGYWGLDTTIAVNARLGFKNKKVFDKDSVMALQKTLNMGRF